MPSARARAIAPERFLTSSLPYTGRGPHRGGDRETPGIDTLGIVYLGDSQVSEASTASFLRMRTNPPAARRVLRGRLQATGFVSPVQAFGARQLLAAQAEEGCLSWEVRPAAVSTRAPLLQLIQPRITQRRRGSNA